MVPVGGAIHRVEELGAALAVVVVFLVLVQRDPCPVGEETHGVDEVEVVHVTHEGDGVADVLAPKQ